jgi:AcrR family transcriptional regulator
MDPATADVREKDDSRNATEEAILAAAVEALEEESYDRMTIDSIARRAFVSRTSVYFYFANKRAIVDRLIQNAFLSIREAASPYFDGDGDPRAELRLSLTRVVKEVNRHATTLLLALRIYGESDHLPPEWEPYIRRMVEAAERRIARDQERGIAHADIEARVSAQALTAMVERHIFIDVLGRKGDPRESIRALSQLWWRAVYSGPE